MRWDIENVHTSPLACFVHETQKMYTSPLARFVHERKCTHICIGTHCKAIGQYFGSGATFLLQSWAPWHTAMLRCSLPTNSRTMLSPDLLYCSPADAGLAHDIIGTYCQAKWQSVVFVSFRHWFFTVAGEVMCLGFFLVIPMERVHSWRVVGLLLVSLFLLNGCFKLSLYFY